MIFNISEKLSLHYETFFPFKRVSSKNRKSFKVLVSIGGNIGNSKRRFQYLFQRIEKNNNFKILETSPILKNPPFGFREQNYFYNSVILLETKLYPQKFLKNILFLEKMFGRKRSFRNAPRTLDIDIIFFDKFKIKSQKLIIPHQDWFNRESVLIPLIKIGELK